MTGAVILSWLLLTIVALVAVAAWGRKHTIVDEVGAVLMDIPTTDKLVSGDLKLVFMGADVPPSVPQPSKPKPVRAPAAPRLTLWVRPPWGAQ